MSSPLFRLGGFTIMMLCFFTISSAQWQDTITKRILVISGGGARGAWGAGLSSYLCSPAGGNRTYKFAIGTSTGSLMGPLVLLKEFDKLHTAYTTVEQNSIFN